MPRSPLGLSSSVESYLNSQASEHPVLAELRRVTEPLEWARMQIAPSQAEYLRWLLHLVGARRTIEIGVFTGYSSLATALELPSDGYLLACDVNEEWTNIARKHWALAQVDQKIDLVLSPALETLHSRILDGESNSYDFAFIDADKESYGEYYEACLRLVRPGGVIVLDNMLWGGAVAERSQQSVATRALRELNQRVASDRRVKASLIPVGDGLLLATVL